MATWTLDPVQTTNPKVKYQITITQNSKDIATCSSNVTVSIKFYATSTVTGSGMVYCIIDGTKYSAYVSSTQKITSNGIELFTNTVNIQHYASGGKLLGVSVRCNVDSFTSEMQTFSQELEIVPQKSKLTVTGSTLGSTLTLKATAQKAGYKHTISYVCGSHTGNVTANSTDTTWAFTAPTLWADVEPYNLNVSASFTLETFDGSTSLGKHTINVSLSIPDSVKPSCTINVSDTSIAYGLFGAFVNGMSQIQIDAVGTVAGGSPIQSYVITALGTTYKTASCTTPILSIHSGTQTITATVTDARGRTDTASIDVTVMNYAKPSVTYIAMHRCDADGTENPIGLYGAVDFSYGFSSMNNRNAKAMRLEWKKTTSTSWTSRTLTPAYTQQHAIEIFQADDASAYDVRIIMTDSLHTTEHYTVLSVAYTLMHFHSSGKGVSIGGVSTAEGLDVYMKSNFRDTITAEIEPVYCFCDNLKKTGIYHVRDTSYDMPVPEVGGWVVVKAHGSYVHQEFTTQDGRRYHRLLNPNGTWGSWIYEPKMESGSVVITHTASTINTAVSQHVEFTVQFEAMPAVTATAVSSAPYTAIREVCVNNVTATGCDIVLTRANASNSRVFWIAVL